MLEQGVITAIIGLGNHGNRYYPHRHTIGFRVLDELAKRHGVEWKLEKDLLAHTSIQLAGRKVILVKPQTYMNGSGKVIPWLSKQGVKAQNLLVVHDELEMAFGKLSVRVGGSARGHNGLRSIIEMCGTDFSRLRFGIGRPEHKEDVGNFVLEPFSEPAEEVERLIAQAADMIENMK